ncbi:MAG: hypothetical protein V4687_16815 [Bacteroidota bacterium]
MIKSLFSILLLSLFSCLILHAQENPFIGAWELTGIPADAGYSFQKYFDETGEFYNTRTAGDKVVKTHHGKYVIKNKTEYQEFIAKDTDQFMAKAAGKTAYIYYKFSEDKKLMTLWADPVPGNSGWHETWRRIDVEKLALLGAPINYKSGFLAR